MNLFQNKSNLAYFSALFAVFIWGAFPTMIKGALQYTSIDELLVIRFLTSALLFIAILPAALKKVKGMGLLNFIGFVAAVILGFYSQVYTLDEVPASWYVVVFTFVPILFLVIYPQKLSNMGRAGSFLAMLGMFFFFFSLRHEAGINLKNILLLIISMLSWVGYSVYAKKMHKWFSDREIVALTSFIGLLASLSFWAVDGFAMQGVNFNGFSLSILSGIVLPLALVAYSFSLRFQMVFAMFSQYLEPIFGLLIAAIFLNEEMDLFQYMATAGVLLGTVLLGISTKK